MFKDYDKYLSTSLKVYLFVLIIIFILKLAGFDYFGLDTNNATLDIINEFCIKYNLVYVWQSITLYIYTYIVASIGCNNKNIHKLIICFLPLLILSKVICLKSQIISFILDIVILSIITLIGKGSLKRTYITLLLNFIYQIISLTIRNKTIIIEHNDFVQSIIFNFDYIILSLMTFEIYFNYKKGGNNIWVDGEVYLSSLKKLNLKNLLKKLQRNWHNFKKQDKVTKLTFIIYFIFSLIWNILSIVLILLIAKLNDTFIECIFILTSFWLSKRSFG